MAAVRTMATRNFYTTGENEVLQRKPKPHAEGGKRAALKEVGNKVLAPVENRKASHAIKAAENKPIELPSVKFPIIKNNAARLPSIQVKETRACRLRAQHTRQSIKPPEKKITEVEVKQELKPESGENLQTASGLQQPSSLYNAAISKEPKASSIVVGNNSPKETISINLTKLDVIKRPVVPSAFSSTLLNCAYVIDIDKDDENDPIMLGMYAKDMYKYLREMEVKFPISAQYLMNSKLNGRMRATLIDWLVEVLGEFEMNPETLFLTVAVIDRFLEKHPGTSRNHLQLVGITAVFIASKYEEIMVPDINELVYVSDNAYTKREILTMELKMVKALDCSFGRPLPIHFLRRYSKAERVAPHVHVMAKYFMELGILEYELCHIQPSLLAAAALYISLWLLSRKGNVWSSNLVQYSSYCENDVLPVVKKLSVVIINASSSKLKSVTRKYSKQKNLQVSAHPVLKGVNNLIENI